MAPCYRNDSCKEIFRFVVRFVVCLDRLRDFFLFNVETDEELQPVSSVESEIKPRPEVNGSKGIERWEENEAEADSRAGIKSKGSEEEDEEEIEFKLGNAKLVNNTEFESEPLNDDKKFGNNKEASFSVFKVEAELVEFDELLKEVKIEGRNKVSGNDDVAPTVWDKGNEEELTLLREDKSVNVQDQGISFQFVVFSEEFEFKLDK